MAKKKNNYFKYLGLILIVYSFLYCWKFVENIKTNEKETEKIISKYFYNSYAKVDDVVYTKNEENLNLENNYIGYIEISNYNIKRLIINSVEKEKLDKGFVGTIKGSAGLDDEYGNIIIAGHSIINVFQKLHNAKIGDEIKIVTHLKSYTYTILEKHIISDNDFSYFKQRDNQKILTLVTCENNNKYRLIVVAKLQD